MKTTKTIKNSEYRVIKNGNLFDVWLVSCASGARLSKVAKSLLTEESANEFIQWVKERE
jgi:hypothetical protein